ncbi:MAG: tRNA lysidine(34) synthetase TilS [Pseudomonadota bacterium]
MQLATDLPSRISTALDTLCAGVSGPIGVAVSGGSDSRALFHLAYDWAEARGKSLIVLTVDHGLRPESAKEAASVAGLCQAMNTSHLTLKWSPPQGKASQARVRRARHRLLAEALRAEGGTHILLGHTEDDQVETVAMRQRAGAGEIGLASMRRIAPSPVWPEGRGIALVRPVLSATRSELRRWLISRGHSWIDDPSNTNSDYERVRVRRDLADDPARRKDLLAILVARQEQRAKIDRKLALWLASHTISQSDATIAFTPGDLDAEHLAEGLAYLLMSAAGTDRRAPLESRLRLAADILGGEWRARTLGGAWIAQRQGRVIVARDPGEVSHEGAIERDFEGIWDGRFRIGLSQNRPENGLFWQPGDPANPMARESLPYSLSSTQFAENLVKARLDMTKYLLEQDSLTV